MKRLGVLFVLGLIVTAPALAGSCKPVEVKVGVPVYGDYYYNDPDCQFQGQQYFSCIYTPIKGTLNGTWQFLAEIGSDFASVCEDWNPEHSDDMFSQLYTWFNQVYVPEPLPDYPGMWSGWSLAVMKTNRGELWAQEAFVFHFDALTSDFGFPFSSTMSITGGTGAYEGATGWIGVIANDFGGIMRGQVCVSGE